MTGLPAMRLGIVSDLHGNIAAVRRALQLMGPIDALACAGDAIDQSRFSNEVVALLREHAAHTVLGNHEAWFFAPGGGTARHAEWIDREHRDWLEARPRRLELELAGSRILVTHSTSWGDGFEYVYPHSRDFRRFGEAEADIVIYGHTHVPVARQVGSTLVINPGSAGQGRPTDDGFRFACAVLDLPGREVALIEFDPVFG